MSESDLDYVSKVSGVDFLALREKYKKSSVSEKDKSAPTVTTTTTTGSSSSSAEEDKLGKGKSANEALSAYSICKACNGLGLVKSIYNHMVLERTCEDCDGDALVQTRLDQAVCAAHPIDDR